MQWQHYNSIKSSMWYIEQLLHEIDLSLEKDNKSYSIVEIDLSREQVNLIKRQLKQLYSVLLKVKKDFGLNVEPIKLSRIIDINTGYIWETLEDSRSAKMEKKSGRISSADKKKQLDAYLGKIKGLMNNIREIADYGKI